jgi:hypothetical protein
MEDLSPPVDEHAALSVVLEQGLFRQLAEVDLAFASALFPELPMAGHGLRQTWTKIAQ